MQQYSFRSADAVLNTAVAHEQSAAKCNRSAAVQSLVRDGLLYRRWMREQAELARYSLLQNAAAVGAEVEHDHQETGP